MFDPSIEELREYVNNYKLNNNHETNTQNGTTQLFSDDELIKLLESESDTSANLDEHSETTELTEKTANSNVDVQSRPNVLIVATNDVEGLTLEIRESFYSKLCSALSSNYKTTFNKRDSIRLTESNVCDIAKKMEYGILSTAKDFNSYKLAGADAVVNIEKETCYRNLYKSLFNEIELLRLHSKMKTLTSENPQQEPTVSSTETESSPCKESEFQDAQSKTEPMAVDTGNNNSAKLIDSQNAVVSESEYFSCSSADHSIFESQQNSETCTVTSNSQETIIDLTKKKQLGKKKEVRNEEPRPISTNDSITNPNNDYVEKIPTDSGDFLNEVHSTNMEELAPVCTNENSQEISCSSTDHSPVESQETSETCSVTSNSQESVTNLLREKQLEEVEKAESEESRSILTNDSVTMCNNNNRHHVKKISVDPSNVLKELQSSNVNMELGSARTKGIPRKKRRKRKAHTLLAKQNECSEENRTKKPKLAESEATSKAVTTINIKNKNREKIDYRLKDCCVRLDRNFANTSVANKALPLQLKIKVEPECSETKLSSTDLLRIKYNKNQMSSKNDSTNDTTYKKRSELNNNKINSTYENSGSPGRIHKLFPPDVMCSIKTELDITQLSLHDKNKEFIDKKYSYSIAVENEGSSLVREVVSNELENNTILQYSEKNLENESASSLDTCTYSETSTQDSTTKQSISSIVSTSTVDDRFCFSVDSHSCDKNTVKESNCLIDEEAFVLERARLDKLCEEMKKCQKEESDADIIHSDYKKIFGIIIPIIRKYYPSEFIPDDLSYGHILQNLQIDLTHADMCDDDIALYVNDSIKTRRYLCQRCIVQ